MNSCEVLRTVRSILRQSLLTGGAAVAMAPMTIEAATLPKTCAGNTCIGVTGFVTGGNATATITADTLRVQQTTDTAILNWQSFNVSADGKVIFQQPSSTSIALNRIFQDSPSQIFGTVTANGQIYLLNPNGIVFGSTARVNVGGLLASSLNISDDTFKAGLLSAAQKALPALKSDGRLYVTDPNGNPITPVQISVQPGAQISTNGASERILLAGQQVTNSGTLSAPDGQVLLAAGDSVYLYASSDPKLRGLLVEVSGSTALSAIKDGGRVTNDTTGTVSADRGNVTLIGLAVNQNGRISATTSTSANGSIRLIARNTSPGNVAPPQVAGAPPDFSVQTGGSLELGPHSVTSATPDPTDTSTAVDGQVQLPSTLELFGQRIALDGGSRIVAPDGLLTVTAQASVTATPGADPNAMIRMDTGASIDLSGSTATASVTRNLVSVDLRSNELADDPLQRNGPIRGKTVVVDARADNGKGTSFANVQGSIDLIQRGILERTSRGGSASFKSDGDVSIASGATINVSGGAVDYTGGIMQTTQLVRADGKLVDISQADPNQLYVDVLNPIFRSVSDRWGVVRLIPSPGVAHYEQGYTQGASAGSLSFVGRTMVLNGTFLGKAVSGPYQRDAGTLPPGGQFTIGDPAALKTSPVDFDAPAVQLVSSAPNIVFDNSTPLPASLPLQLPVDFMTNGGFSRVQINSNSSITLPSGSALALPPDISLALTAARVDIGSSVTAPAGTLAFTSIDSASSSGSNTGVSISPGVRLDVSGLWTNDWLLPQGTQPNGMVLPNAGSISLSQQSLGGILSLGSGDQLIADGGAWMKQSGALVGGQGGQISIASQINQLAPSTAANGGGMIQVGDGIRVEAFGVQGATGGTLSLKMPRIEIGSGDSAWLPAQSVSVDPTKGSALKLDPAVFSDFGFSNFTFTADGPRSTDPRQPYVFTIDPNTQISTSTRTVWLEAQARNRASAASLAGIGAPTLLPLYQRSASHLEFDALPESSNLNSGDQIGAILVGANARLSADPGSSLKIQSLGTIEFDGAVAMPSGSVSMAILSPTGAGFANNIDPGFVPDLRIELGKTANVDVSGTAIHTPNDSGLLLGKVLPGGSVTLDAARGFVVTDAGSVINFSGTQAALDLQSPLSASVPSRQTVASAGGSLSIAALEAISMLGQFDGAAGSGASGRAMGGTLSLSLDQFTLGNAGVDTRFSSAPRVIELTPDAAAYSPAYSNRAVLDSGILAASGIDSLNLKAEGAIELAGGTRLQLGRNVVLQSPAIIVDAGTPASVTAPYIALGAGLHSASFVAKSPQPGQASVQFNADQIDLIGSLAFQGVASATLASTGDIQLRGDENTAAHTNAGSLSIMGDLTLSASRVVPSTTANYTINANFGAGNTVQFTQAGSPPGVPLSVNGSLTVNAANIVQGGTIVAPFGSIALNATNSLTLASGSLTSVSANGALLPYGQVQNETDWIYTADTTNPTAVTAIPQRQVTLHAPTVTLAKGSTVDLSGGGDVYAYEWTPGTGGSKDALANGTIPGLYAVIPSLGSRYAPYDPVMYQGSSLQAGASIYLSGVAGLPAGTYALLPARYALLPGAYLVQAAPGYTNLQPGQAAATADGAPIAAGYLSFGNTGLGGSQYSGFIVRPGSYGHQLAQYTDFTASSFFAGQHGTSAASAPPLTLPADAGILSLSVDKSLNALGTVLSKAAKGGKGADIDISATQLEVDPTLAGASTQPGVVHVSTDVLSSWNPGSILLGGLHTANGTVQVTADSVHVTAGSSVVADQVVAVANQGITVDGGAIFQSTSAHAGSAPSASAFAKPTSLALSGSNASGAAVLAVSDLSYLIADRGTGSASSNANVVLGPGAQVSSLGALTLDAPGGAQIADGAISGQGAHWSLGAGHVVLGGTRGSSTPGTLTVDSSLIGALDNAYSVRIASQTSIDLPQPVNIAAAGSAPVHDLTLSGTVLNNTSGASSTFAATRITLSGNATAAPQPVAGAGKLTLSADEIDLGAGNLAVSGFAETDLYANSALVGRGAGTLTAAGSVDVRTALITTAGGATTSLTTDGSLHLGAALAGTGTSASTITPGLGGAFTASGQTLLDETKIVLPSGNVTLSGARQLTVQSGAAIDVSGVTPSFAVAAHGSPGGSIILRSTGDTGQPAGSISVANGTLLNVAGASGADAGSIDVASTGAVGLDGSFRSSSNVGLLSGSFSVVAGSLDDFNSLNQRLQAAGFSQERDFRVNRGDLDLTAGSTITAHHAELSADQGSVTVEGTIDATDSGERGYIGLNAGSNIVVASTGRLMANGGDAASRGGSIELLSRNGQVSLQAGSDIEASGAGSTGQLTVRAPRTASGTNMSLSVPDAKGFFSKVNSVYIEPIWSEQWNSSAPLTDLTTLMSSVSSQVPAVFANLEGQKALQADNVHLRPYVDVTSSGDLTLGSLTLDGWKFTGRNSDTQPIDIAFRASGNLTVAGTVSAGFTTRGTGTRTNPKYTDLNCTITTSCTSAGITLVAGSDSRAASATATALGSAAELNVTGGSIVRTATGDITLAAASDINIGDTNGSASIYTAGNLIAKTVPKSQSSPAQVFASGDSRISITAGGNIKANSVQQFVTDWQTSTKLSDSASWGVSFDNFGWSVGALGGGDVDIRAAGNIRNLSAAVADEATVNTVAGTSARVKSGPGNLTLHAGGDIGTPYLYVADGFGRVSAGGAIDSTNSYIGDNSNPVPVGALLLAGNASWSLQARQNILLEGIGQPSLYAAHDTDPSFFRYGGDSLLRVISTGGAVQMSQNVENDIERAFMRAGAHPIGTSFDVLPANVDIASYSGDVSLAASHFYLFASDSGSLSVVAAHDIVADSTTMNVLDAPASQLNTATSLQGTTAPATVFTVSNPARHMDDAIPVTFSAGNDINGLTLSSAKSVSITAGEDVHNLNLNAQNLHATDTSVISAGRDIVYDKGGAGLTSRIEVGGPGQLDLLAGRNIDFGYSAGVTTVGNLVNGNLPSGGASVTALAGLGAPLGVASASATSPQDFISKIIEPSSSYQQQLESYVAGLSGTRVSDFNTAATQFRGLSEAQQLPLLASVFFNELVTAGRAANNDPKTGFRGGYAAIDALFPGSRPGVSGPANPYSGDLSLAFSQIYTLNGGSIALMVPGGQVDVGLAVAPAGLATNAPGVASKQAFQLGIVAAGAGDVDIFSQNDVLVNSSRVFTLGGGNIVIWSTLGNIDAGRGAKSAISAPPPVAVVSNTGAVTVDFSATVNGSGIRTIRTSQAEPLGNVDLIAPAGFVNAGDAGIGSAGNLNIAAVRVIGVDNIQVGGTATGVPPETSGLGAALSGAATAGSSTTSAANSAVSEAAGAENRAAPLADTALGWLDVFVEGFGENVCKANDAECLKREQHSPQ